eukprot:scaffold83940_cov33-Prasinocladus_malaysianus.AAC.1
MRDVSGSVRLGLLRVIRCGPSHGFELRGDVLKSGPLGSLPPQGAGDPAYPRQGWPRVEY